ncbi:MAG: GspE/PulE family protein [Verrucomicrobiota bacterium]|nr:GspE/PulE family protein [Verrucomicrobiota bacterium]
MKKTAEYVQGRALAAIEIGQLVNLIVGDAVECGASDIHIEPWEDHLMVRLRLNGVLTELVHAPLELTDKIAARLKVMANLVNYVTDLPQEGHVPASPEIGNVELRISVFPTVRGEKIVIRIFDPSKRSFDLSQLGFEQSSLRTFISMLSRPSGLLLLTGPTGSGKTTVIYAALTHLINRFGLSISISTVEDPVEFHLPMVSQAQINPNKEFSYPIALRSLMRQDPQVIMIGEIRDAETAAIAVQAGLTGHLVISTIHSGSTAGVFARLINMEIEPFLLSSSIVGVMGLRLIRNNCPYCARPYQPEPSNLRILPPELVENASFRKGDGCEQCSNTGFLGRSSITEMLIVDEPIRDAILQKLPTRTLQKVAVESGMRPLWDAGLTHVANGSTTLEELLRVVAVDQF